MKKSNYVVVEKGVLASIIGTLQKIDVRGYESMNMLVGCVNALSTGYENGVLGVAKVQSGDTVVEEDSEEEG